MTSNKEIIPSNQFKIPVVDFSSFLSLDYESSLPKQDDIVITPAQQNTANEIDAANRKHGFVCLRNTGIPKSTIDAAFQSSQTLFNLNDDVKLNVLKKLNPTTNTGYAGFGVEALNKNRKPDLKEAFNIRHPSFGNGDLNGTPDEFELNSLQLWNDLKILGYRFSVCCALSLGIQNDYFAKTLTDMDLCTLRMLHYPPCDEGDNDTDSNRQVKGSTAIRVGEHTDFGIFTFLFVKDIQDESSHGLQVKAVEGCDLSSTSGSNDSFFFEGWNDVIFDEETIETVNNDESSAVIVNTGALMARWTNDIWRATAHRVVVSSVEARLSHRYSIAMFFDPDKETLCSVHPKLIEESGGEAKYEPIKSIDYLMIKLMEAQGVKGQGAPN